MPETNDDLIAEAQQLAIAAEALNRKLRKKRKPYAQYDDPMNAAVELSGSRNWDRVVFYLEQANKQEKAKRGKT